MIAYTSEDLNYCVHIQYEFSQLGWDIWVQVSCLMDVTLVSLSVGYFVSLYVHLYAHLSVYLSVYLSVHLSVYLSVHLSVHLSVYLSVHLSVYLSVCKDVGLFLYLDNQQPSS